MLHINILCVGKLKEKYFKEALQEYSKRLSKYCSLNIIEIDDKRIPNKKNHSVINQIKNLESNDILKHIPKNTYIICLDLQGKEYSSEDFALKINSIQSISSSLTFIIGGSLGFNDDIRNISNEKICFSKMTFPHQLIRIFLLEQIYRGFKINNGEEYHK